jgi:hypothetical protein
VKGHVYQKMRENVAETVDGGVERLLERIEQPAVREFFGQRFFGGSWYDALPMTILAAAHARLLGVPLHYHCRERGRIIAGRDVPGIYRALLKLVSPERLVGQLPRAAALYFDFGVASIEWVAPNVARTTLAGLPDVLGVMLAGIVEGFMATALELTGARDVRVRTVSVVYDGGEVSGICTAALQHEATWAR